MSRGRADGDYGYPAGDQDEDYDWIKYLGEGRPGSAAGGQAKPLGRQAPARGFGGGRASGRGDRRADVVPPAAPVPGPAGAARGPVGAAGGPAGAARGPAGAARGPAGDYSRPLYEGLSPDQAIPVPAQWPAQRPGRQAALPAARPDSRLDTSEYARPLYPPDDTGPVGPPRRRRKDTSELPGPAARPALEPPSQRKAQAAPPAVRPYQAAEPDDTDPRPIPRPAAPRPAARPRGGAASRQAGARRQLGRTARRLPRWLMIMSGCLIVAVAGAAAYLLLAPRPAHVVSTPSRLGAFTKEPNLDSSTAQELRNKIVAGAAGEVKNVVAAVYEQATGPGTSQGPQIIVLIGGNLTGGGSASGFIGGFVTQLHGTFTTSPGRLGGQAACAPGSNGGPAECAWADGDTFGVVVSATLSAEGLANEMRLMRPHIEHAAKLAGGSNWPAAW